MAQRDSPLGHMNTLIAFNRHMQLLSRDERTWDLKGPEMHRAMTRRICTWRSGIPKLHWSCREQLFEE
jgi:hypothetical protein